MSKIVDVTYYVHSGFSCAIDENFFIFDYWRGQDPEELEGHDLTVEKLKNYKNVYVFITHSHPDHFDPIVYEWYKELPVNYIVSYEMPIGSRGKRMNPGDTYKISEKIQVKAFDSTDLGVSYLLSYEDINIFHAGDLNFWHWREESTAQEIDEAEVQFKNAMEPIKKENIDIAFFPVDPRLGRLFDAGANYFLMSVKPRLMIPMHFWQKNEIAVEFARRSRSRDSEVLAMTKPGEKIRLEFTDDGYMVINILDNKRTDSVFADRDGYIDLDKYEEKDPFQDTDLPVKFDE
jgi:L-ascorbate metabolism protein UlaG (beta-lactamase superfamily)